jgi:lipid-A-disaccharide synthase
MRVLISTGEVSGDVAGALVAEELLRQHRGATIFGIGGARLEQAGVDIAFSTIHLGTVGVSESVAAIPGLFRAIRIIRKRVAADRPDVALLIGNDIFNVILGRWLRAKRIRTVSWFPPQVWIWRSLAWQFARSFDRVLASFPDEQRVYEQHCSDTHFVGHYLADKLTPVTPHQRAGARAHFGITSERVVGILPGSRRQEVNALTEEFLDTAVALRTTRPDLRFLLPISDPCFEGVIRSAVAQRELQDVIRIVNGESHQVMRASDVVLIASGTASLEATLLGVPMVTAYKVSALTLFIVRLAIRAGLMDSETTALPNLVLGRAAVPELKQRAAASDGLAHHVENLLDDGFARRKMLRDLAEAAGKLRANDSVGQVVQHLVNPATTGSSIPAVIEESAHEH